LEHHEKFEGKKEEIKVSFLEDFFEDYIFTW